MNVQTENWVVQNQVAEFNFSITYDPTLLTDTFVARELISNKKVYSSNYLFPDSPELSYLTMCIGYALDGNGDPYRYSRINVIDFSVEKIFPTPAIPTLMYSDNTITMSCETSGAKVHYRIGYSGEFTQYSQPIEISQDTTI